MANTPGPRPELPNKAARKPDDLPALTKRQIHYRARTLARLFHLNEHDREDLIQDLSFAVVRAMRKYDPSRASRTTFARAVCDVWYACHARRLRFAAVVRAHTVPWGYDAEVEVTEKRGAPANRAEVAMDAADCLLKMPEYQRLAVLMLERLTETEIAEVLGVDRGTIRRWFAHDAKKYREIRATNGRF